MPDVRRPQQKGNLIVVAHVVTPTRLSDTERQKLEEFAELRGDQSHHHASEQRTMWDRFKRVLRGED
jgi:DnaJ-class molecular chaperone